LRKSHIFVGTKAQFIKMAPLMKELDRRCIPYNFIDSGQHAQLTGDFTDQLKLKKPDVYLRREKTNINNIPQAILWTIKNVMQIVFCRRSIMENIFRGKRGICLIHGDTLSTLLSLLYAKRCGLEVAHVEAGLRSFHIFDPFPEEMIRLFVMRFSDVLFAPSEWAAENLKKMGYERKTILVRGNTIIDTIRLVLTEGKSAVRPQNEAYVVVTIHRIETIYSFSRLSIVIDLVEQIAQNRKVIFILHEPTKQQLLKYDFLDRISANKAITISPLQPYPVFLKLIAEADFIVTDGGSIQEESYFNGVPCLVMRSKTERMEGLGENAYLSDFNQDKIRRFLQSYHTIPRKSLTDTNLYPSRDIVEHIMPCA
jgi:UDP-N-acetylglucosamine 2-epimerase